MDFFLNQQSESGHWESEGQFTLAKEKALEKIANFQLPFENAWILKLVQWAVCGGNTTPIEVALQLKETRFVFGEFDCTLDTIEQEFFNPEPQGNRALGHLLAALWAIGLAEKSTFLLCLPDQNEGLLWNGDRLERRKLPQVPRQVSLAIGAPQQGTGAVGWVKSMIGSSSRNADLLSILSERCFTCPVPLSVDGRRIDSYFHCPTHKDSETNIVLTLETHEAALPSLTTPPQTFHRKVLSNRQAQLRLTKFPYDPTYRDVRIEASKSQTIPQSANVACLLTAHRTWTTSGQKPEWLDASQRNLLLWIQDGVVVEESQLLRGSFAMSTTVFISADGLRNDMTGLKLVECEEKKSRYHKMITAMHSLLEKGEAVREAANLALAKAQKTGKNWSRALWAAGAASVATGQLPLAGLLGVAGVVSLKMSGGKMRNEIQALNRKLDLLASTFLEERHHLDRFSKSSPSSRQAKSSNKRR